MRGQGVRWAGRRRGSVGRGGGRDRPAGQGCLAPRIGPGRRVAEMLGSRGRGRGAQGWQRARAGRNRGCDGARAKKDGRRAGAGAGGAAPGETRRGGLTKLGGAPARAGAPGRARGQTRAFWGRARSGTRERQGALVSLLGRGGCQPVERLSVLRVGCCLLRFGLEVARAVRALALPRGSGVKTQP